MNRAEALTVAREHVTALATASATFTVKCAAVESFARFLIEGEPDTIEIRTMDQEHPEPLAAWERELLDASRSTFRKPGDRFRDADGDVWTAGPTLRLHIREGSPGVTFEHAERHHGPLVQLGSEDA